MSQTAQSDLEAILHHAAVATIPDRSFLRVTGTDATRWLNGMVTNSVQALAPGEGCFCFLLNAQGRILGDCTVYREPANEPAFLLETFDAQLQAVQKHLDGFIIMDDVELTRDPANDGILLLGPDAPRLLAAAGLPSPEALHLTHADTLHGHVQVLTPRAGRIPAFEIRSSVSELPALRSTFLAAGAREISGDALEAARLLEARPLYGRDITEKYLPQEANQPDALHFHKGCYIGQEIVERIRSRGQVHRVLIPLTLSGALPGELPAPLTANGQPAGEITSAGLVPLADGPQLLALGYVRREALDMQQTLTYAGGTATPRTASTP